MSLLAKVTIMPESHVSKEINTVHAAAARLGIDRLAAFFFTVESMKAPRLKSASSALNPLLDVPFIDRAPPHLGGAIQKYLRSFEKPSTREPKHPIQESLHLGKRKDGSQQTEVYLITPDPARIQQLKAFGMARGSTPTSFVIAFMGDYMRNLLVSLENDGMVTKDWELKWKIVTSVQKKMRRLEDLERNLMPGNFQSQEIFRREILKTLDEALKKNEKLSLNIASTNGRLHQSLHAARQFIWGYRFPKQAFSKEDQLYFTYDKNNPLIYQPSMHMSMNDGLYPGLRALLKYRHQTPSQIKPAKSVNNLSYWYYSLLAMFQSTSVHIADFTDFKKSSANSGNLKDLRRSRNLRHLRNAVTALKEAEVGGLAGAWLIVKGLAATVPRYIASVFGTGNYFKLEISSLQENIFGQIKSNSISIQPPRPYEKISQPESGYWVQPKQVYDPEVHYNFIARLARSVQIYLSSIEGMLLQHPVAGTTALAASIISCSAILAPAAFKNLIMQAGLNKTSAESFIAVLNKMMALDSSSSTVSKLDASARLVMQENALAQSISQRDPTIAASRILAISKSLGAVLGVGLYPAHSAVASALTEGEEYQRFQQDLNKVALQFQIAILNAPKEHPGFMGALLLQPFRLFLPPLRLLMVPFIALIAQRSREAFSKALIKELKNTAHELSRAALFVANFTFLTAFTLFNLTATFVNVLHNTVFKLLYKPIGTLGAVAKGLGALLQYGYKSLYEKAEAGSSAAYLLLMILSPMGLLGFLLKRAGQYALVLSEAIVEIKGISEKLGHGLVNVTAQYLFRAPLFLADKLYTKAATLLGVDLGIHKTSATPTVPLVEKEFPQSGHESLKDKSAPTKVTKGNSPILFSAEKGVARSAIEAEKPTKPTSGKRRKRSL